LPEELSRSKSAILITISKVDALFRDVKGVKEWSKLPPKARRFVEYVEDQLKVPATVISTGEDLEDMVDLR